jgi:hypothetical protein
LKLAASSIVLAVTFSSAAVDAYAASVACMSNSKHPVCIAVFAAYPPGSQSAGTVMTGTAKVTGKTVQWTCQGATSRQTPRPCQY